MNFKDFKAGRYVQQYEYRSFSPAPVNHAWTWDAPDLNTLLESAAQAIAELNAFSLIVPDVDLFLQMHVAKEANTSSRIEGTQTEIDEVIQPKELVDPEHRDDWQEVRNYIRAMNQAIEDLDRLPLSNRLLRDTHRILLDGVRGEAKTPGEFRTSQNWIGGSGPSDAFFVPPHHEEVGELTADLEKFWHNKKIHVPHLIRVAIAHYQFETIHPFLDGNGRIGRLLITLYLVSMGVLKKPTFYLSAYMEKNKDTYYDALTRVRTSNDLEGWIRFFLQATLETARSGRATFEEILRLRTKVEQLTLSLGRRAENANKLLNRLYEHPMITPKKTAELLDVTRQSAAILIRKFEALGILEKGWKTERNQMYIFRQYLNLFME